MISRVWLHPSRIHAVPLNDGDDLDDWPSNEISPRGLTVMFAGQVNSRVENQVMAYIKQTSEEEAQGTVGKVYEAAKKRVGHIANIIRVMSLDGNSLQGSIQFYTGLMKSDNALTAAQREMLATVVSNVNMCYY